MKTAEEFEAKKTELADMDEKLAALSEEELAQVAGGSRRTDDPDQYEAHKCYNFAWFYIEEYSTTLPESIKEAFIADIKYLWDRTLTWHLADPDELYPKTQTVLMNLEPYIGWEAPLKNAYDKLKQALTHLENLKKKDA